jgi:pimeloyl-ACP methyl ester carboxylesterase
MSRRAGRLLRRLTLVGLGLIGCVLVVVILLATYQAIATARERARFPIPGRLIDVGGYRLHLRCDGIGSPTVVLESGFGMSSNEWALVQPELTRFTRACSYDRAGYGWSDSGPPQDAVEVLHALLPKGGIFEPYVMVGHSYGSALVRRYAYHFPDEVAGIVLTATSYPDEELLRKAAESSKRDRCLFETYAGTTRSGLLRIMPEGFLPEMFRGYFGLLRKYLPSQAAQSEIAFLHQTRHVQSLVLEADHPSPTEEQDDAAACSRGFGDVPLVVLTERWVYSPAADQKEREEARREEERQMRLARLSSRGKKIDVDGGHLIPLEHPAVVIDAIRDVVDTARQMR